MKISYRTLPVLRVLADKEIPRSIILDSRKPDALNNVILQNAQRVLLKRWDEFRLKTIQSIDIITKPFADAIDKSEKKLAEANLISELKPQYGVLVSSEKEFQTSIMYNIRRVQVEGKSASAVDLIHFHKDSIVALQFVEENFVFVCDYFSEANGGYERYLKQLIGGLQFALLFKQFAQIETKYLAAGKKETTATCKYMNDTSIDVTIMDSTWFTTLVKSDAFKVRGHFRLQPKKKDGEWTKELIWISDFEKQGYTRKAGLLKTQENESNTEH